MLAFASLVSAEPPNPTVGSAGGSPSTKGTTSTENGSQHIYCLCFFNGHEHPTEEVSVIDFVGYVNIQKKKRERKGRKSWYEF